MSQSSMRGMRLGSQSLETESGVAFSERTKQLYICANQHSSELNFALGVEIPNVWECKNCSEPAILQVDGAAVHIEADSAVTGRTHWEMLLERRSKGELQEILEERLEYIHARRAKGQADL